MPRIKMASAKKEVLIKSCSDYKVVTVLKISSKADYQRCLMGGLVLSTVKTSEIIPNMS